MGNNPVNYVDPTGHVVRTILSDIGGAWTDKDYAYQDELRSEVAKQEFWNQEHQGSGQTTTDSSHERVEGGFSHDDKIPYKEGHCNLYEGCAGSVGVADVRGEYTSGGKVGVVTGYEVSALTLDGGVTWPLAFLSEDFKPVEPPKIEAGLAGSLAQATGNIGIRIGHLAITITSGVNVGAGFKATVGGGEGFKLRASALLVLGIQIRSMQ